MMVAVIILTLAALPLLSMVSFVQVLYLEATRLRTRDLPAIKFFKETLEDRLGMKTEQGATSFSLVKHTLLAFIGIGFFVWFEDDQPLHWGAVWQAGLTTWLTMMMAAYAI